MPRKPTPAPDLTPPPVREDLVREDLDAATRLGQQLAVVDHQYGDAVVPYERERVVAEARFFVAAAAHSLIELGRRLVLLREHEPHGEFIAAVQRIGIDPRFAQRAMQATVKLGRGEIRRQVEHLGQSKLLELLVLDDEEIEVLAAGGTVADLTLDDVDRMPVRELRAALRKERADRVETEALHTRQLEEKNRKLDDLDRALARRDKMPAEDQVAELVGGIWDAVRDHITAQQTLRVAFAAARDNVPTDQVVPGAIYLAQCQALVWLMQRLEDIRREFELYDVSPLTPVTAPWETPDQPEGRQAA